MGILAKRFPEYGVTLQIFRGVITREAWMEYYAGFTATDASRFITYVCPSADLSKIDLASGPELKRVSTRSSPAASAQPSPAMTNSWVIGMIGM